MYARTTASGFLRAKTLWKSKQNMKRKPSGSPRSRLVIRAGSVATIGHGKTWTGRVVTFLIAPVACSLMAHISSSASLLCTRPTGIASSSHAHIPIV